MFGWGKKKKQEEAEAAEAAQAQETAQDEAVTEVTPEESSGQDASDSDTAEENASGESAEENASEEKISVDNAFEEIGQDEAAPSEEMTAQASPEEIAEEDAAEQESAAGDPAAEAAEKEEPKTEEPAEDAEAGEEDASEGAEPEAEKKKSWLRRLWEGLTKARRSFARSLGHIFSAFSAIDDDFYEELEETLISADLGVRTTDRILEELKERVEEERIKEPAACRQILIDSIRSVMNVGENAYEFEERTSVLLVVGVNGVGKTTTIGKLASQMKKNGRKVLLAAADTFRAAATEQIRIWAQRADVGLIAAGEGADPAAVVYDAVSAAKARKADILIVDTAGRLHNKKNLMEELRKISRVIEREYPEAYRETLAVVDATTGQNALQQAREFQEVADVSGIILTKMDGTAKGGIAVAIQSELGLPVKYIGVGEHIDDLQKFDSSAYVEALFAEEE